MVKQASCRDQAGNVRGRQSLADLRSNGFDAAGLAPVALPTYLSRASEAHTGGSGLRADPIPAFKLCNCRFQFGCQEVRGSLYFLSQGKLGTAFLKDGGWGGSVSNPRQHGLKRRRRKT